MYRPFQAVRKYLIITLVVALLCPMMDTAPISASSVPAEPEPDPPIVELRTDSIPAFPGAEGGGKYTTGGRGGDVYEVTTLADSGPGSLREGVARSNTTVVFRVGGTIHLESPLKITGSNLTIAGQTAPGEGITVANYETTLQADNVIIRYMRFRLGDRYPSEGDAFGGRYNENIIIDHCSFSWSVDEVLSMYVNENTTVQWSVISESMLMTTHQKGRHGYAGIWGGNNATFHHNLIAHNVSRNPRFAGDPNQPTDMYNNIIYDWGFFSSYGGEEGLYNLRNNYYKYGPSTYKSVRDQVFLDVSANTRIFIDGNYMYGSPEVTANNWAGVGAVVNPQSALQTAVEMPYPSVPESAYAAYEQVLSHAGANLPRRDAVDARIVQEVKDGAGRHINSQKEVGGYLDFVETVSSLADDDHDGMPNEWEIDFGLDPNDPADRNHIHSSGYTNLEMYLNSITGNGSMNPSIDIVSPKDHTLFSEGASIEINTEASDSDGSVSKVEFYANDVKIGEDSSAPFAFTWEDVQDGTYFLTARAIDDTGTATQSSNVAIHVNKTGSTAPWASVDIGTPGITGHTQLEETPAHVTVKSAGDIGGGSEDHFHYAYQPLTGNGEIVARIERITATDDEAGAGIMIREQLNESSKFAALLVSYVKYGVKSIAMQRASEGADAVRVEPDHFIDATVWVKLVRLGDQFTSLISNNGTDWTVIHSVSIPMEETIYIGLVADAAKVDDDVYKYNTSTFTQVAVNELDAEFPIAPTDLAAIAGEKSVALQWTEVPGANAYHVFRSEIAGGDYTQIANGIETPSFVDTDLVVGKTYYYYVKAENQYGASFNSNVVSAVPEGDSETIYYIDEDFETISKDTTPGGFLYAPNPQDADHKVIVTDLPSNSTGNSSSQALMLYDNGAGSTEFFRSFAPQKGKFVMEVDITAPGWPGTATVLSLQDERGSKNALSFQIRRPTAPVVENNYTLVYKRNGADYKLMDAPINNQWYNLKIVVNVPAQTADIYIDNTLMADNAPLESSFQDSGIGRITAKTPGSGKGTLYYDNLKVHVEPVESPNDLSALPGNGMVQLTWTAADEAASYTVKRSLSDGGPYSPIATGVTDSTYIDSSVENGTTYYYVITASGSLGESGPSNQVIVVPSEDAVRPDAPAGLSASPRNSQADLVWNEVASAISYKVKRSTSKEGPFIAVASGITTTNYRDGGLDNGLRYYYVVSAVGIGGESSTSDSTVVVPSAELSTPVLSVQPEPAGARLQWEAVSGAVTYSVYRAELPEGPFSLVASSVTDSTYTDSALIQGIPYYYKLVAANDYTYSLDSSVVSVRPEAEEGGAPSSPSDLKAEPGHESIELSWAEVHGAASYTVMRSESRSGPFAVIQAGVTESFFTDTGLVNGTNYYYNVSAVNEVGIGAASATVVETPARVLTVALDGSGEFSKVQDAINAVTDNSSTPTIIRIKDGIYREKLSLSSKKVKVRMIGDSREGTVLINGDSASTLDENGNAMGTSGSYSFRVEATDFIAEHLTIQNDAGKDAGQAVALLATADRLMLRDVSLKGHQDTLYANGGRQYYIDSYIEGTVDFIFGNATAVFENSVIHSMGGGYVTAASTGPGKPGYIFLNSRITGEPGVSGVALGRPWRADAHVVYVNSYLGEHISPEGWNNWGRVSNEQTARYGEFASYGPGANAKARHRWTSQLTVEEAAQYLPSIVLAGSDDWNPTR